MLFNLGEVGYILSLSLQIAQANNHSDRGLGLAATILVEQGQGFTFYSVGQGDIVLLCFSSLSIFVFSCKFLVLGGRGIECREPYPFSVGHNLYLPLISVFRFCVAGQPICVSSNTRRRRFKQRTYRSNTFFEKCQTHRVRGFCHCERRELVIVQLRRFVFFFSFWLLR